VNVVTPLTVAGADRASVLAAVKAIQPGGSTALYAGWAEGLSQAMACPVPDASARVVLLSDGRANSGVSDAPTIAADVSQAATHGVTTTTMGFGRSYDENLLRAMADAGQGNYVFIEAASQVAEAFQHELAGLSALRGRNVRLEPSSGVLLASAVAGRLPRHGTGVMLPDLVAGLERELALSATFVAGAIEPTVSLVWTDLLSEDEERLTVRLGVEPLSRSEFDALPEDPGVTTQVALARIANLKFGLSSAFRSGHSAQAATLLEQFAVAVAALPHGQDRCVEESELGRLRNLARTNETAIAARYSEKFARDRTYGASDSKRSMQFSKERELHSLKMREVEAARQQGAADAAASAGPAKAAATLGANATGSEGAPGAGTTVGRRRAAGPALRRPLTAVEMIGPNGAVNVQVMVDDITTQDVDVLVNSSNRRLFGNAGVDGAVHRRGGPELTQAARQLGRLDYGQAAFTPGFRLPARYVVHAVAMPWQGGIAGELSVLEQAYRSAYAVASQLDARTLAVAAIGTGSYGVPRDVAARVAVNALRDAVKRGVPFRDVRFVVLDSDVAKAFAVELSTHSANDTSGQPN
ncbi:MAG TPA: macro domain-containing protein, partial [Trueperaceae bacterium]|nr:macro domain-containing protein [Trueperaceae bacterium]